MRRLVIIVLVVLLVPGLALAQTQAKTTSALGVTPQDRAAAEQQIIANERAAIAAFLKGDVAGFKSRVWPEAFGVDAMAGVIQLPDWEKMMKDLKAEGWDIDQAQVHWVAPATAILTYHWTGSGTIRGQAVSKHWAASVYVKRGEKWLPIFNMDAGPEETGPRTVR